MLDPKVGCNQAHAGQLRTAVTSRESKGRNEDQQEIAGIEGLSHAAIIIDSVFVAFGERKAWPHAGFEGVFREPSCPAAKGLTSDDDDHSTSASGCVNHHPRA